MMLFERGAVILLNEEASTFDTALKKARLACIAAAIIAEGSRELEEQEFLLSGLPIEFQKGLGSLKTYLEQEGRLDTAGWIKAVSGLPGKAWKVFEEDLKERLQEAAGLYEVPSLLNEDMYYKTAGNTLKEYRFPNQLYLKETESLKAELLEEGTVSEDAVVLLWMVEQGMKEKDIFSEAEWKEISAKKAKMFLENEQMKMLFNADVRKPGAKVLHSFGKGWEAVFKSKYAVGIAQAFPFLHREESVFMDTESMMPKDGEFLSNILCRLEEDGFQCKVRRAGQVPLVEIDQVLYELVPSAVTQGRIPIHGIRFRRYMI